MLERRNWYKACDFQNASGADALGNKVSPYDIAIITKEALKYPVVLEYMNSTRTTLHTSERSQRLQTMDEKNYMTIHMQLEVKAVYQHSENIQS